MFKPLNVLCLFYMTSKQFLSNLIHVRTEVSIISFLWSFKGACSARETLFSIKSWPLEDANWIHSWGIVHLIFLNARGAKKKNKLEKVLNLNFIYVILLQLDSLSGRGDICRSCKRSEGRNRGMFDGLWDTPLVLLYIEFIHEILSQASIA